MLKFMTGNELREAYLKFFAEKKNHLRLPSYSLIPENDPTLLMIGAGMAPLKPYFTGKIEPPRHRVTTCQRCVRTGDIENVGHTARHQTYFEMLGNFSFGDYFKEEAISWAWEFLTEVVELPKDKLYATIYPKDDEAGEIWKRQKGFDPTHLVKLEDNFWEIGPGPCGPDSEIYIDLGEERGCGKPTCAVGCDCDRYLEIWNLVFTQFDKQENGEYLTLTHKNIDTGCGLERLASVLQNKPSNFETDLLFPIIEYASQRANKKYGEDADNDVSFKVIADHVRSVSIMIMDGIQPSNEGRGYVLRRILRRAKLHGKKLGIEGNFLADAVDQVAKIYQGAADFSALQEKKDYIKKVMQLEEERFEQTLTLGTQLLKEAMENLKQSGKKILDGDTVFKLYDTYGFPWELTEEILQAHGFEMEEFTQQMADQRERARASRKKNERLIFTDLQNRLNTKEFAYDETAKQGKVMAIWKDNAFAQTLQQGDEALIILDKTPFYAEGGGQIGDTGCLKTQTGEFSVATAKKLEDGTIYHEGRVENGTLSVGDDVEIVLNEVEKLASSRNHTATHLLQAALQRIVGPHVHQAGSLVTNEKLRFDFTSFEPVSKEQLQAVEDLVNEEILKATDVDIQWMSQEEAKKTGAMALFGEKYGDIVRVVTVPNFSKEFCGGCHVKNIGTIGLFKIVSETGVAAGVRRIEAITGKQAIAFANEQLHTLDTLKAMLKLTGNSEEVLHQADQLTNEFKSMKKEVDKLKTMQEKSEAQTLLTAVKKIGDVSLVQGRANVKSVNELRDMVDLICDKLENGLVILHTIFKEEGKVNFILKANKGAVNLGIDCGKICKEMAKICGGGGGGRKDFAQAGGKLLDKLPEAMEKANELIKNQLS